MRCKAIAAIVSGLILAPCMLVAQAPPAGASGKCKDGSYTTALSKQGACKGHNGVDTWYALSPTPAKSSSPAPALASGASTPAPDAPAPASPAAAPVSAAPASAASASAATAAAPAPASTPAALKTATSRSSTAGKTPVPGGGPGLVWLNASSRIYHCYGSTNYGTTKEGKYMSEADARAAGGKPSRGQACAAK